MRKIPCEVFTPLEAERITDLPRSRLRRLNTKGVIRCGRLPDGSRRYWREDIAALVKQDPGAPERIRRVDAWWSE